MRANNKDNVYGKQHYINRLELYRQGKKLDGIFRYVDVVLDVM